MISQRTQVPVTRPHRTLGVGSDALVGAELLQIITAGMYSDPLAIYREYLQNAADSAAQDEKGKVVHVDISMDSLNERVTIRDNGRGLSQEEILRNLLPIGRSSKVFGSTLGFRGIGRLAGLAFARSVTFLTRDRRTAPVTGVRWDREQLRSCVARGKTAEEAIAQSVTIEPHEDGNAPGNFFEVQIDGVTRPAAGALLNRERVASYVSQVCSVPFSTEFPFERDVEQILKDRVHAPRLSVHLDGAMEPVKRPHRENLAARSQRQDSYGDLERIEIPKMDARSSDDLLAVGWIAHSSYYGALPRIGQVRGVRARIRNFQIGDERVFEHLFTEPRFNQWCVAEVHILDPRLRPNGRRDYFEPGPHLRHLENQLVGVCRRLEKQCRRASRDRNARRRVENVVGDVSDACDLARSGYLTEKAVRVLIERQRSGIEKAWRGSEPVDGALLSPQLKGAEDALQHLEKAFVEGDLEGLGPAEATAYRNVFAVIAEVAASPRQARETIEAILDAVRPYSPGTAGQEAGGRFDSGAGRGRK